MASVSEDIVRDIKRANQRLRQLEKDGLANESSAYRYIMRVAQQNLASDTKVKQFAVTRSGQIKFRTDLAALKKENLNTYRAMLKKVEGFLDAGTSTKIGIQDAHKKAYETFKQKFNYKGDFKDWSDMWNYASFKELVKRFKNVSDALSIVDDVASHFNNLTQEQLYDEIAQSTFKSKTAIIGFIRDKHPDDYTGEYEEID